MKLFQQMLVAGATLGLLFPVAAQASDIVNLEEMNSYSRSKAKSSRLDSKTYINEVSEDIANLKGRVDSLEVKQNEFEAGGFSDTTSLDGKAVFALMGTDHSKVQAGADDGIDSLPSVPVTSSAPSIAPTHITAVPPITVVSEKVPASN